MEACILFAFFLMIGCFVGAPANAKYYKEGITHDKGLTIIRSSGPHHRGRPVNAFSHTDAKAKYTRKGKHRTTEHVYDGHDKHDEMLRDARSRLRDWEKYEEHEPVPLEPHEEFRDLSDSRETKRHLMNNGKTIVFNGDESRHPVQDVMHPENQDAERKKSGTNDGRATVFSGNDRGDKGFKQDPRKSSSVQTFGDIRPHDIQPVREQTEEPSDDQDSEVSRDKRSEKQVLQRMKRMDDDELSLQRMKRLDEEESTLQRMKRFDDESPTLREKRSDNEKKSLDRVKRLDEDEPSYSRPKTFQEKPKIFEGLPIEPQITRFDDDDNEALSRMKRMQNEKLRKYDEELSRMKRHDEG